MDASVEHIDHLHIMINTYFPTVRVDSSKAYSTNFILLSKYTVTAIFSIQTKFIRGNLVKFWVTHDFHLSSELTKRKVVEDADILSASLTSSRALFIKVGQTSADVTPTPYVV